MEGVSGLKIGDESGCRPRGGRSGKRWLKYQWENQLLTAQVLKKEGGFGDKKIGYRRRGICDDWTDSGEGAGGELSRRDRKLRVSKS